MPKIVILNGPPRCGKDTGANIVEQHFGSSVCKHLKLSQPLKDFAQQILPYKAAWLEENKFRTLKSCGMSYVEAQIALFTQLAKVFGQSWLGNVLAYKIVAMEQPYFVLSDGGRYDDISPLIRAFGAADILIVQIMREGCSFSNDIRTYIAAPNVKVKPIINKDILEFQHEMLEICGDFFADGE